MDFEPANESHEQQTASTVKPIAAEYTIEGNPSFKSWVVRAPLWLKISSVVAVLALGGAGAVYAAGASDRSYLSEIHKQGLATYFANDSIALAHAHSFCTSLDQGKAAEGFRYDKLAVQTYCDKYLQGFKVVPTPQEQQTTLLAQLRKNDLGGLYSSDIEAVSKSKKVCADLQNGSAQQGPLANYIAVKVYCASYVNGYRVLKPIAVTGKFSIFESDPYGWFPSIAASGGKCTGYSGYSDIDSSTDVKITNAKGEVLTTTELGDGHGGSTKCVFTYHFTVMEGESAYYIEIGRRGKMKFSETELKTPGSLYSLGLY